MQVGRSVLAGAAVLMLTAAASAAPLTFTKLAGLTGTAPSAVTAAYKADLSSLGLANILSITIEDNSGGLGGAVGQFSGFDLDGIKLSTVDCADAACVAGAASLSVFDFVGAGTLFTPGTQRAPADPKLFGTGPAGNTVDEAVATLGFFDAVGTTAIPGAAGYISLGDNGRLAFNLTSAVSTAGLFLYIGEVGDNGEVAAGAISVADRPVPEPASLVLLGMGLVVAATALRRRGVAR